MATYGFSTHSTPPTQPPEQALSSMKSSSPMRSSSISSKTRMTFSMPSAARYFSFNSAEDSPPEVAQLTPIMPEFESDSRSFGVSLSMRLESCGKISLMAMAPSTSDFSMPMGMRISVTFAGHGVMKKQPICSFGRPVFCMACCFAILAAVSMGDKSGRTWSQRSGKRTRIKRTTAGQAELMTGRCKVPASIRRRVASLTSSAAPETSMTSSNPSFLRPDKT